MSHKKIVSLIAAVADNGVIGNNGKLPWDDPEDLKWFKHMTMGKTVIMGRKTFDGLPRELHLHGDREFLRATCEGPTIEAMIAFAKSKEVFIAGGAQIYEYAIKNNLINRYYIGRIKGEPVGDTYFPPLSFGATGNALRGPQLQLYAQEKRA